MFPYKKLQAEQLETEILGLTLCYVLALVQVHSR